MYKSVELIEVTKEQFEFFVRHYPNKLCFDYCGISTPPLITYNDFSIAPKWPWSIVAQHHDGDSYKYEVAKDAFDIMMKKEKGNA